MTEKSGETPPAPTLSRRTLLQAAAVLAAAGGAAAAVELTRSGSSTASTVRAIVPPVPSATTAPRAVTRNLAAPAPYSRIRAAPPAHRPGHVWRRPASRVHDLMPDAPRDAIALTIDDGPHPIWTPRILRLLAAYDVSASFCVIGVEAHARPALVRAVAGEGHAIVNHTYSHPQPWNALDGRRMLAEMTRTQEAVHRATGHAPQLFRSPGGEWSPLALKTTAARGLLPVDWDVDPRDWSRPGWRLVAARMLAARPGDIVLCHDGGGDRSQTYAALVHVLPRWRAAGIRSIALTPTLGS